LEEVRKNKQDFFFLLLHDSSSSVGLNQRVHTHLNSTKLMTKLGEMFLTHIAESRPQIWILFLQCSEVLSRDPRRFFTSFGISFTIEFMGSQDSSSILSHLVRTWNSFPSCRRSMKPRLRALLHHVESVSVVVFYVYMPISEGLKTRRMNVLFCFRDQMTETKT